VTSAQVEAWVSTKRGSIFEANREIDRSFADAALGRMMLHRRRAIAASVLNSFFSGMRGGSAAYVSVQQVPVGHIGNNALGTLLDAESERTIAARAGDLVACTDGISPPLLFERALLAEADGRLEDALADLKQVVATYPGSVAAATPAARMALDAGDAVESIRLIASVEGEITHTRAGAALLADVARAVGLHESASRYDLAALTCRGGYDSHGNDCVPIDLLGKIADDVRMPQLLYLEGQVDGSVICNAGGLYYNVRPYVGRLLTLANRGRKLSRMRSLGPTAPSRREHAFAATASAVLRLSIENRFPNVPSQLRRIAVSSRAVLKFAWISLSRVIVQGTRLAMRIDLALVLLTYRLYRRLPRPIRRWVSETVQSAKGWLKPKVRDRIGRNLGPRSRWPLFLPVSTAANAQLTKVRYEAGLARIFGLEAYGDGQAVTPFARSFSYEVANLPPNVTARKMATSDVLPPAAANALRRLISEAEVAPTA
jgi:hypothetical protein